MKTEIFPSMNKYLQHIRCNDTELCRVIREIDSMMSFIRYLPVKAFIFDRDGDGIKPDNIYFYKTYMEDGCLNFFVPREGTSKIYKRDARLHANELKTWR